MSSNDLTLQPDPAMVDPARGQETAALKLALLGAAGASIEWYDFFLYATAAALVFPTVFFSATLPPFVALIASFSTFAVGFVARPIGAVLFGHVGDKLGRKGALAAALIMMGAATTLVGVLPSYHTAGVFSPLALILLRLIQGLAVGGQWGGAILLATENAPPQRRGLYGSIVQASVPAGVLLANLAVLVVNAAVSPEGFMTYAWRIPFLFSFVLVGLGIFIQLRVEDTAAFRLLHQSKSAAPGNDPTIDGRVGVAGATGAHGAPSRRRSPVLEALVSYPRLIPLAAAAYISTNLSFYIFITYVVAYGTSASGLQLPRSTMLTAVLIANVATIPVLFLAGRLSDRYGRRGIFMTGVALGGIWAFVLFPLLDTRSAPLITLALLVGGCLNSLTYGPLAAMFTELFSTRVRYSAASLAYQLGSIAGGGLAPMIAAALYAKFHSNIGVSMYMASACGVSIICASRLKETRGTAL
jgi:MFS family permease